MNDFRHQLENCRRTCVKVRREWEDTDDVANQLSRQRDRAREDMQLNGVPDTTLDSLEAEWTVADEARHWARRELQIQQRALARNVRNFGFCSGPIFHS